MCLWPRLPWRIRFHRDGFEGVVPCRECPGCLELERQRLAARLHEKYGIAAKSHPTRGSQAVGAGEKHDGNAAIRYFIIRIWAPIETHASISHALHRRPRL